MRARWNSGSLNSLPMVVCHSRAGVSDYPGATQAALRVKLLWGHCCHGELGSHTDVQDTGGRSPAKKHEHSQLWASGSLTFQDVPFTGSRAWAREEAHLHNEQLCFGGAHGSTYAAENGNGVLVVPIVQNQPQQVRIAVLPSGYRICNNCRLIATEDPQCQRQGMLLEQICSPSIQFNTQMSSTWKV